MDNAETFLRALFDRAVEVALLWTSGPLLMPLPEALLREALERAPVP